MLVKEFYKTLKSKKFRQNFSVFYTDLGELRLYHKTLTPVFTFCPVTAVCFYKNKRTYDPLYYRQAAQEMGLRKRDADRIADAADRMSNRENTLHKIKECLGV